nr:integrase, catalytic region, zinc finger, CCHC-type, peptidase aspartic, catalytic [Tanacetum cinerariifolium]
MSSNSDDIQAAGSDTRPFMLDRTDYDSWSQRIRLYFKGKENEIYILQLIDHGLFELKTTRDTFGTTPEGGVLLRPERPRTCDDLNDNEKKRFNVDVRATNIMLQGLPKDIYKLINHNIEAKAISDNVKMLLAGSELTKEDRESQLYDELERFKMLPSENINEYYVWGNRIRLRGTFLREMMQLEMGRGHRLELEMSMQDKMLLMQAQENGVMLDEEELLILTGEQTNNFDAYVDDHPVRDLTLNDDNIFQAYECDAFDSDVDDEPTA